MVVNYIVNCSQTLALYVDSPTGRVVVDGALLIPSTPQPALSLPTRELIAFKLATRKG